MKKQILNPTTLFLTVAIILVAMVRLISIPIPNFAPLGAIALFGAATFRNKMAGFIIPITALLISDIALELTTGMGFHNTMIFVYGSFILIGLLGTLLRNNVSVPRLALGSLGASIIFFVVSNFGYWLLSPFLPGNIAGLALSYEMALPFFHYTLLGDLFFVSVLFFAYNFYKKKAIIPAYSV